MIIAGKEVNTSKYDDIPIINIHLSPKCSMKCSYCFESKIKMELKPIEELTDWINKILESNNQKTYIDFYGSEISVELDRLNYILKNINLDKCHSFTFMTNGLLNAKKLIDAMDKYGDVVTVSLDFGEKIHDERRLDIQGNKTYRKVLSNIKYMAVDRNKRVRVSSVYDTETTLISQEDFDNFIKDIQDANAYNVSLNMLNKFDYSNEEVEKMYGLADKIINYYKNTSKKHINIKIKSEFDISNVEECILSKNEPSCPAKKSHTITGNGEISSCLYHVCNDNTFVNKNILLLGNTTNGLNNKHKLVKALIQNGKCSDCKLMKFCRNSCISMYLNNEDGSCIPARKKLSKVIIYLYENVLKLDNIKDIMNELSNNKYKALGEEYTNEIINMLKREIKIAKEFIDE